MSKYDELIKFINKLTNDTDYVVFEEDRQILDKVLDELADIKRTIFHKNIKHEVCIDKKIPRYYVVESIKYDFENDGSYSEFDLKKTNENKKYGTYYHARKYAQALYNKYKNELNKDLQIIITDELVELEIEKQTAVKEFAEEIKDKMNQDITIAEDYWKVLRIMHNLLKERGIE